MREISHVWNQMRQSHVYPMKMNTWKQSTKYHLSDFKVCLFVLLAFSLFLLFSILLYVVQHPQNWKINCRDLNVITYISHRICEIPGNWCVILSSFAISFHRFYSLFDLNDLCTHEIGMVVIFIVTCMNGVFSSVIQVIIVQNGANRHNRWHTISESDLMFVCIAMLLCVSYGCNKFVCDGNYSEHLWW